MRISIFTGDITEAPAEAICTSTNPRLSLAMGTGGAVRERGGWEIQRACEAIVEEEFRKTGRRHVRVGSVHVTSAGNLPYKLVIHCVASDPVHHRSSADIIRHCTRSAVSTAAAASVSRLAMPVFGTGHAHFRFNEALTAMAGALRESEPLVDEVVVVIADPDRAADARAVLRESVAGSNVVLG